MHTGFEKVLVLFQAQGFFVAQLALALFVLVSEVGIQVGVLMKSKIARENGVQTTISVRT